MHLETDVEQYIRTTLEGVGFKVLKLVTPGTTGVMDRMILRPRYWPGPPMFLEIKRGGKELRAKQAAIGIEWERRGCNVLGSVHGMDEAKVLCGSLIAASYDARQRAKLSDFNDPLSS